MKSTERHDLAQNELADVLGRTYRRIKPYLLVGGAAIVVIVAIIVWTSYRSGQAKRDHDQAMTSLMAAMQAGDPKETDLTKITDARIASLESFLAGNKVESVGRQGQLFVASEYSKKAVLGLAGGVADKAGAEKVREFIAKARVGYETVAKGKDELATLATYNLACLDATEAELDLRVATAAGSSDAEANAKKAKAIDRLTEMTKQEKTTVGLLANQRLQSLKMKPLVFDKESPKSDVGTPKAEEKKPEAATPSTGEPKATGQGGEAKPAGPAADPAKTSVESKQPATTGEPAK
jgi:hypothetical protein